MRMVRRIALYAGLVLLALLVSVAVALAAFAFGVPANAAQWVGFGVLLVCAAVIVYFMEFRRP
jgi:hypothetical protein